MEGWVVGGGGGKGMSWGVEKFSGGGRNFRVAGGFGKFSFLLRGVMFFRFLVGRHFSRSLRFLMGLRYCQ